MSEHLTYHTPDQLRALSDDALQSLWELVPTERQKAYRSAYERELGNAGALGSDLLERQVNAELLRRYTTDALVPVGSRWARTPARVQDAARADLPLNDPHPADARPARLPPAVWIAGASMIVILLALVFTRPGRGEPVPVPEDITTQTPEIIPTPTPPVFDIPDTIVTGGDAARAVAYPVQLRIHPPDAEPRVWVVQRRAVRAAEWHYDPNPEVASFVNGMSVRPVIGIPWSEDNAALFADLDAGAEFVLTLNTGAVLRYTFAGREAVRRSDTGVFRQVSPGLALLLIGEVDADGLPTATRWLIRADYPPEQELSRGEGEPDDLPTPEPSPTPTPEPRALLHADLFAVSTADDRLITRLRVFNAGERVAHFTPDDLWLTTGYTPDPPGPRTPAEGLPPFALLPGQAVDLTLIWAWRGEPYAALQVHEWRWGIRLK